MVDWHLKAARQQLRQLATAFRLALALNRTLILPQVGPCTRCAAAAISARYIPAAVTGAPACPASCQPPTLPVQLHAWQFVAGTGLNWTAAAGRPAWLNLLTIPSHPPTLPPCLHRSCLPGAIATGQSWTTAAFLEPTTPGCRLWRRWTTLQVCTRCVTPTVCSNCRRGAALCSAGRSAAAAARRPCGEPQHGAPCAPVLSAPQNPPASVPTPTPAPTTGPPSAFASTASCTTPARRRACW